MSKVSAATEILKLIIAKLDDVADELTFIGGATISLYLTESEMVTIRPTKDVDAVV